jgi:Nuclease-related domain
MSQKARQYRAAENARERPRYQDARTRQDERSRQHERAAGAHRARARQRWLAWLGGVLPVPRDQRQAQPASPAPGQPADQGHARTAGLTRERPAATVPAATTPGGTTPGGITPGGSTPGGITPGGSTLAATVLGGTLGAEWTLFRGYRNRRGEIDDLLLGPRGVFAIASKHHNATVSCAGDLWWYAQHDSHGIPVSGPAELISGGRSPSDQLNEPAGQLEGFLDYSGHPVTIQCVVLLTHPRACVGSCTNPTVHIATSADEIISLVNRSHLAIADGERAELDRLIRLDHSYHERLRRTAEPRESPVAAAAAPAEGPAPATSVADFPAAFGPP